MECVMERCEGLEWQYMHRAGPRRALGHVTVLTCLRTTSSGAKMRAPIFFGAHPSTSCRCALVRAPKVEE